MLALIMLGMKRIALPICLFLLLLQSGFAQVQVDERIPPKGEIREAQNLAARFFNSYQNTQDISPLIKEFFIRDFSTRLKFCRTSGECGGFGRDFWGKDEELTKVHGTERDYLRGYINSINYFYLYSRSIVFLASLAGKQLSESEEDSENIVEQKLREELKGNPEALKLNFFGNPDESLPKLMSLGEFHARQIKYEQLVVALRTIERKLRTELVRKRPKTILRVRPSEFRVYKEPNKGRFFKYSTEIQVYDVSSAKDNILFKIDIIRDGRKLKIVAVYPPMD